MSSPRMGIPDNQTTESVGVDRRMRRLENALKNAKPQVVTALPTNSVYGQEIIFQTVAMAALSPPVAWRLWYDGGKWMPIGATPLFAEILSDQSRAVNSYGDLTTIGPSITLPVAGDYLIAVGVRSITNAYMAYSGAGITANDDDAAVAISSGGRASVSRERMKTGLTAGAVVSKYKGTSGTAEFERRWMRITPARLG